MRNGSQLQFPASAKWTDQGLLVGFVPILLDHFSDPFVHETLARHPTAERTEFLYPWHKLKPYSDASVGAKPLGIIMHPARVGSTLQVACLRVANGIAAYSEPPAINELLYELLEPSTTSGQRENTIAGLRLVVDLIGRHADGAFALKLRSWNSLFAPLICEAFPATPWVFTVRSPVEVGVSIERKPPTWMRTFTDKSNPFLRFAAAYNEPMSRENYFASMFASFCDAIAKVDKRLGYLVRYEQLPKDMWETVCPHFGIRLTTDEVNRIKAIARYDAKRGGLFVPDRLSKQAAASSNLREAVSRLADPALARLEASFSRLNVTPHRS